MVRILVRGLLVCALFLHLVVPAGAQPRFAGEAEIKTAFLYNFTKFVSWPTSAFPSPSSPFRICLLGDISTETVLTSLQAKMVAERTIEVVTSRNLQDIAACQILFIGDDEQDLRQAAFSAVEGKPVLTVGESRGFAQQGGGINFYIVEDRVLFEVNLAATRQAGLTVSSRLLSLARILPGVN